MRPSIKAKQVAGVTGIVGLAVIVLSLLYLTSLVRIRLEESEARAAMIGKMAFQRAAEVVASGADPREALTDDAGLRNTLQSALYGKSITYAAIVDVHDVVLAHDDAAAIGTTLVAQQELESLIHAGPIAELRAIYEPGGRTLEVTQPIFLDNQRFGAVRVGVSTLLIRDDVYTALVPAVYTAVGALVAALVVAVALSQIMLRPIHMIRAGLSRLGKGEAGVVVELPQERELAELSESFNTIARQLSAERTERAGQSATLASVVEHLEDAVAIVSPSGELLFANPAMRSALPAMPFGRRMADVLPPDHPYRRAIEATFASRAAQAPFAASVPSPSAEPAAAGASPDAGERLILTHVIEDRDAQPLGVMLIARNLGYLSHVQATLDYSRKLAALGRLSAGIAHEVKNPLNATMIHLELLKQQLADARVERGDGVGHGGVASAEALDLAAAMDHLTIIEGEMRRLDEVVQGFLRFTRPEDLKLQPVAVGGLIEDLVPILKAEATKRGVTLDVRYPADLPRINADPAMLQQAFLNLALNACQAMPDGGTLRLLAARAAGGNVEVRVEDTGSGIAPEHLDRIFDLYFTTKSGGSGIGLSMVYRTVQLHAGDIEVQSTLGAGTTFRLLFQAI